MDHSLDRDATIGESRRWQEHSNQLMAHYAPLQESMLAIQHAHPDSKRGTQSDIAQMDGLSRCIDMVPNIAHHLYLLTDIHSPTLLKDVLKWKPKTEAIMHETETMLFEYGADSAAIYHCWKVKEQLDAIYDEAKKQLDPKPHVTNADLAAAARLGEPRKKGKE